MDAVLVVALVLSVASLLLKLRLRMRGAWTGIATICLLCALLVPEGVFRWALLILAFAVLVPAFAKVPRAFWYRYRVVVALGVCSIAAILASEAFDLDSTAFLWVIGILSGLFVTAAIVAAVGVIKSIRSGRARSSPIV